jgi:hypothetical protein
MVSACRSRGDADDEVRAQHTVELLEALEHTGGGGRVASLLLRNVALLGLLALGRLPCYGVNGTSYDSSSRDIQRAKVVVKVRRVARARGATRLAAAIAERWTNMAGTIGWSGEGGRGCRAGDVGQS